MGQRSDEIAEQSSAVRAEPEAEGDARDDSESEFHATAAAAREEIEVTRADMTSTIEAIQERLDPEVLSEQAKDTAHDVTDYAIREAKDAAREITDQAIAQAREAVRDVSGQAKLALRKATIGKVEHMARSATESAGGWRQGVMETIKANPMPAALAGLGVGWMLLNRPSTSSRQLSGFSYGGGNNIKPGNYAPSAYGQSSSPTGGLRGATAAAQGTVGRVQETAGQMVDQVQDTAGNVMDQVQDTAEQVMDQVQETGGQVVDQVQEQAARAQTFLQRQMEENPLLVAAVAVAIGGALAGTIRSSTREDQLLGDTRDRLMDSAKELSQEAMHKVGRVADEAQNAAKQEAREQSLVPESDAPKIPS